MIAWSVKLSEFGLLYEPRGPIKSQCLANFVFELQNDLYVGEGWTLYVYGSSSKKESGDGIVLEGPGDIKVEQSLILKFETSKKTKPSMRLL